MFKGVYYLDRVMQSVNLQKAVWNENRILPLKDC